MKLKEYFLSRYGEQAKMADALGISQSQMSQMVKGICAISNERCVIIEKLTDGMVSRKDLKPDAWQRIWPELVGQDWANAHPRGGDHSEVQRLHFDTTD